LHPGDHPQQPDGLEVRTETGGWWLERIRHTRRPVMLFGAGHVGQAVAHALAPLPFGLTWVDSRDGVFPDDRPGAIQTVTTNDPASLVAGARPGTIYVVMTHSHELDEDICFEILRRDDFAWLGLIGSDTKRRRFVHRLEKRGIAPGRLEALNCPIGLAGIRGKQPATIALSLAAQLMMDNEE
jgi:xanthine dehydrogenase accessory factor